MSLGAAGLVLGARTGACSVCRWTQHCATPGAPGPRVIPGTSYLVGYALAREDVHLTLCRPHAEELRRMREDIRGEIPR